ncbi:hypothetical protein KBC77_02630 [Candidatus Saccharibacteria bacterium]|nr:hypothetical protein [Candidatus Saccharibacteria bacterium]
MQWYKGEQAGYWAFAVALFLAYPLVLTYSLAIFEGVGQIAQNLLHPKKFGKHLLASILESQVRRLRKKHRFTVVAVAGSVGKTSTKTAVAQVLGQRYRVLYQRGNYNDRLTVPLIFFGISAPNVLNVFAWMRRLGAIESAISQPYPYDVVVVELGTDVLGQMRQFAYLKPDLTVLTSIAPEHMQNFTSLDDVAAEELQVFTYSKKVLANIDDIAPKYLAKLQFASYGYGKSDYRISTKAQGIQPQTLTVTYKRTKLTTRSAILGEPGAKSVTAAMATAHMLGMPSTEIVEAVASVNPVAGRLQLLEGKRESILIDDTYNASPSAVQAALKLLYSVKSTQRIALLGSMNELGVHSKLAHQAVGSACDPKKLDIVVVVGQEAGRWLAPKARAMGCEVHVFTSPYAAGNFVAKRLKKGAVVLAKGSQNGVFLEEALKPLIKHPSDTAKLVRQNQAWAIAKKKAFR